MTKVSVIILTWNSAKVISQCLDSLASQTMQDFEVIIVDNGSSDSDAIDLPAHWPEIDFQINKLEKNIGFASACNLGAAMSKGDWLAMLNSDAFPEPEWLERLLIAAQSHPEFSFFASRQLQANAPHLLDGAGDAFHVSGLAWRRFSGYPASLFGLDPMEVFSSCAAAALYLRQAFLKVGGFDEDFFSYHEDVDLSFRLRLQGYRCLYVPDAVVHHVGSASVGAASDFALYHWQRNFIWSFVQNVPSGILWEALPSHLMANLIYQLNYTIRGRGGILWKAKMDALRGLSQALRKRREIQKTRTASHREILSTMERGWLQPYLLGYHIRKISRTGPASK